MASFFQRAASPATTPAARRLRGRRNAPPSSAYERPCRHGSSRGGRSAGPDPALCRLYFDVLPNSGMAVARLGEIIEELGETPVEVARRVAQILLDLCVVAANELDGSLRHSSRFMSLSDPAQFLKRRTSRRNEGFESCPASSTKLLEVEKPQQPCGGFLVASLPECLCHVRTVDNPNSWVIRWKNPLSVGVNAMAGETSKKSTQVAKKAAVKPVSYTHLRA